jgi:hypothetical protein
MRVLIIGYGQNGKDELAKIWEENFEITHESSSHAAMRLFIFDVLKDKYGYSNMKECYEDRVNHRAEWYDLICKYNVNDPTRLARHIMRDSNIYVGMRDKVGVSTCKGRGVFDLVVWVDAEKRVGKEDSDSCTVTKSDAHVIIDNNDDLDTFRSRAITLGKVLFCGQ